MNHSNSDVLISKPEPYILHTESVLEILRNDWIRKEAPTDAEIDAIK